jgi:hypothetical protein
LFVVVVVVVFVVIAVTAATAAFSVTSTSCYKSIVFNQHCKYLDRSILSATDYRTTSILGQESGFFTDLSFNVRIRSYFDLSFVRAGEMTVSFICLELCPVVCCIWCAS